MRIFNINKHKVGLYCSKRLNWLIFSAIFEKKRILPTLSEVRLADYQSEILEYLARYELASVEDLSRYLKVSPSTIRRHLAQLQDKGLIVRTHGGATLPHPIRYDPQFGSRASRQAEAKHLIALAARSLVSPNQVIGISGGTTCTEFSRLIRGIKNLTVVTNAVNVAMELRGAENMRVLLTGGLLNQNSYELIGNLVTETLKMSIWMLRSWELVE